MHFGTLPPEINSGLMHSGPGSRSMMDAAIAWDGLAIRLYDTAVQYSSVNSKLATGSAALLEAVAAHIDWLNVVAAQAEKTATQARSAASAYELALTAMVPPSAIQANRMLRTWLAATNCLGQYSPAIADAEGDYEQMWAQDVDTMHSYAEASADAATVTPLRSPPAIAGPGETITRAPGSWTLKAAPDMVAAGRQVISVIPDALGALSAAPMTAFDAFLSPVSSSLSKLASLSAPSDFAINHLNSLNKRAALDNAAAMLSLLPNRGRAAATPVTTGFGRATSVGTLSVPRGWLANTPHSETTAPRHGWDYQPMRLVETAESPTWPLTR
ncbi:PPE family protein [Mycobacterium montefiorense]|uniref:PPE family protein n=1 Tax=Mycobacterium montefiorense TaxID=154654 RepID=UPI0021F32ECB|nr:PPE family protein [Mycobacterium montefiorense]MCV7427861.1 PPE family protein [Mycobacterium montefiorense]GLE51762.1 PPE family protein [Mycobacterium montefiorense]